MDSSVESPDKFSSIYKQELEHIQLRRESLSEREIEFGTAIEVSEAKRNDASESAEATEQQEAQRIHELQAKSLEHDLCGLAISGGGIRSATFGLGVLQGLTKSTLLPRFDYLSTVSGGGYIGSFFSKWVHEKSFKAAEEGLLGSFENTNDSPDSELLRIHARRDTSKEINHPVSYTHLTLPTKA